MRLKCPLVCLLLCLLITSSGLGQSHYADDCFTSVDNATAIIPSNVDPSLPNGTTLAPADTIAIQDSGGNCVGYGVWANDGEALTIAAAGSTSVFDATVGLAPNASLSWEVFDASTGSVVDLNSDVHYAACDTLSVPTCQNDRRYADGALFVLEGFQNTPYRRSVSGEDGTRNNAGWRMMSLPAAEATRSTLEDDLNFQATSGSLMYRWTNGQWVAQTSSSDSLTRGTGFLLYLFDNADDPVDADGLPFDVSRGPENAHSDKHVDGLDQSQEWNLLGNPFPVAFDLGALAGGDLAAAGFQATIQIWNPELDQYQQIIQGNTGDDIAAWQGFFLQRSTIGSGQTSLTFGSEGRMAGRGSLIGEQTIENKALTATSKGTSSKATSTSTEIILELELTDGDGRLVNTDRMRYWIDQRADLGYDAYEARDLSPPSGSSYGSVTLPITKDGELIHRALGAAPPPDDPTAFHRATPLSIRSEGTSGTATLFWPDELDDSVPRDWGVHLLDTETDSTVNLRTQSYEFPLEKGDSLSSPSDARFRLVLEAKDDDLPVELTQFDGSASEKRVTLRWKTASEQNNAGFHIERRGSDPPHKWTRVAFVDGTGTTTNPQRYHFTDADLPYAADTLRYRLRQVDTDGATMSSEPITVTRGSVDELQLLGTFPNPAKNHATVRYAIPEQEQGNEGVQLALYDLMGRQIRVLKQDVEAGRHERRLSVSNLASGVYFLRLQAEHTVRTRKLTVIH